MWDCGIDIHDVRVIRTRSDIYFGAGAIDSIDTIAAQMVARGVKSALVVTGRSSYKVTGAWAKIAPALDRAKIRYAVYDGVTPNPTTGQVDTAVALGADIGAGAVIAIGGGSAIDAGKGAAILLKNPGKSAAALFNGEFAPAEALPILAVNLTHGTGSESNRFAVVTDTEKNFKPVIAFDCIYPVWSIDDPALMVTLSENQTRFVSIDAVNHVIEAATSRSANPLAVMLGTETVKLVAKYLPLALREPGNLTARYFLAYAAMIAGVAFDNGLLHYTHALEHPLSALHPELAHGLGLSILLPAVIREIYAARSAVLADLLTPIVPGLTGVPGEAVKAAKGVERWLVSVGVSEKLTDFGFSAKDVDDLVDLTLQTPSLSGLLDQAPTQANRLSIASIYLNAMGWVS